MHHSLRFYGEHQHFVLKLYVTLAKLTGVPLAGRLARYIANRYGQRQHRVYSLTHEEALQIVDDSTTVALGPCSCRHVFHNCDTPVMSEIVVGTGVAVFSKVRQDELKVITKAEAKEILRQCHDNNLIHTIAKCRDDFYAICNCCNCCCVPLKLSKKYGIRTAIIRNNSVIEDYRKQQL